MAELTLASLENNHSYRFFGLFELLSEYRFFRMRLSNNKDRRGQVYKNAPHTVLNCKYGMKKSVETRRWCYNNNVDWRAFIAANRCPVEF